MCCKLLFNNFLCSWFCGNIQRADAEIKLLTSGLPNGTFLVWTSNTSPADNLTLSVRHDDTVRHYSINTLKNGKLCIEPTSILHILNTHEPTVCYQENETVLEEEFTDTDPGKTTACIQSKAMT